MDVKPLQDRVAIVTGGGSGIGAGIASTLAERGARVVIAEINPTSGKACADELNQQGYQALFVHTDVSDTTSIHQMIEEAVGQYGQIDILVNNVGVAPRVDFEDLTLDAWNALLNTNLTSMFQCTQACLPQLKRSAHANIVNLTSVNASITIPRMGAYPASKAGIIGLTRSLALDLAPEIRVNAIAPGVIMTDAWRALGNVDEMVAHRVRYIPRRRIGTPQDIGKAVAFLASDEADFITGQVLTVDGGMTSQLYASD